MGGGPWRVVWSLKDWALTQLPDDLNRTQFYCSTWIPQQEILSQSQCVAFLTHGGWGGLMEAACAGVPVLVLPFFGDQPGNAKMVERSGWGLALSSQNVFPNKMPKGQAPQYKGRLSAKDVRRKLTELVGNETFSRAASRFQVAATRYGGSDGAAL